MATTQYTTPVQVQNLAQAAIKERIGKTIVPLNPITGKIDNKYNDIQDAGNLGRFSATTVVPSTLKANLFYKVDTTTLTDDLVNTNFNITIPKGKLGTVDYDGTTWSFNESAAGNMDAEGVEAALLPLQSDIAKLQDNVKSIPANNIGAISTSGSILSSNSTWRYSDLTKIPANLTLTFNGMTNSNVLTLAKYNEDGTFIKALLKGSNTSDTLESLTYITTEEIYVRYAYDIYQGDIGSLTYPAFATSANVGSLSAKLDPFFAKYNPDKTELSLTNKNTNLLADGTTVATASGVVGVYTSDFTLLKRGERIEGSLFVGYGYGRIVSYDVNKEFKQLVYPGYANNSVATYPVSFAATEDIYVKVSGFLTDGNGSESVLNIYSKGDTNEGLTGFLRMSDVGSLVRGLIQDISEYTKNIVLSSMRKVTTGLLVPLPDALGAYSAFWVRDFVFTFHVYNYPTSILKKAYDLIKSLVPTTGQYAYWIPDHINLDGTPCWKSGTYSSDYNAGWGAKCSLDSYGFLVDIADEYVKKSGDVDFMVSELPFLESALASIKSNNNTVYAATGEESCAFGFYDSVKMNGNLAFPTLQLFTSYTILQRWANSIGVIKNYPIANIKAAFNNYFIVPYNNGESAYVRASDGLSGQYDLFTSSLAVLVGVLTSTNESLVINSIVQEYNNYMWLGHARHMPEGFYYSSSSLWEAFFSQPSMGDYQNGGVWTTHIYWIYNAIAKQNLQLANTLKTDCMYYADKLDYPEYIVSGTQNAVKTKYCASANFVYKISIS